MRIPRIFFDGNLNVDNEIRLSKEITHYLIHVLRLKKNYRIYLFNGDEGEYEALITDLNKHNITVKIQAYQSKYTESPLSIHLAQGISRGDRMDFAIQKAVELGVAFITPIITEYCSLSLKPSQFDKKMQHWQGIIISSSEQSGRTKLPVLKPIQSFQDWITTRSEQIKIICHPQHQKQSLSLTTNVNDVALLIGPEGGFSDEEFMQSLKHNFNCMSLGPRTLRTETATVVAITLLQFWWGDVEIVSVKNSL
jgi:16S rRNA (uracil1498-N3)-methyltransferase